MYLSKNIHFKSLFKGEQSDTIEYKVVGVYHYDDKHNVSFDCEAGTIHLTYDDKEVLLNMGESSLRFVLGEDVWNDYQIPYGNLLLKTHLHKFEHNDHMIKMKYDLHDSNGLLFTVYVMVKMAPYHFNE